MRYLPLGLTGPRPPSAYINDEYVVALLHMDGVNGSQHVLDYSKSNLGHLSISAAVIAANDGYQKFGSGAMYFNGASGFAYWPWRPQPFTMLTQDFTIDWWEMRHDGADSRPSFSWDGAAYTYQRMLVGWCQGGMLYYYISVDGTSWAVSGLSMGAVTPGVYVHYAIVRKGNTVYSFRNGILQGTAAFSGSIPAGQHSPILGLWQTDGSAAAYYNYARIDEWRVSKGIGRWTSNFTPPTVAYAPDLVGYETVLLLHCDTAITVPYNSFPDASRHNNMPYTNSGATLNTTDKKFGAGSINFAGASALTYLYTEDWEFGAGDFTMDWWEKRNATANSYCVAARDSSSTYVPWLIHSVSGRCVFYATSNGSSWDIANNADMGPLTTVWTHRAITRKGTTIRFFQDGVLQGSITSSLGFLANGNLISIGYAQNGAIQFAGQIDEFRIVKGVCAWTSDFAPPIAPYDPSVPVIAQTDPYATSFVVTAPASCTVGTPFNITVQARAAGSNTTNYTGLVHLTGTAGLTFPADFNLVNGTWTVQVTATSNGVKTITATDTVTPGLNGTSGNITATTISAGSVTLGPGTTSWTVPPNFNPANNSFQIYGGGGNGAANSGGVSTMCGGGGGGGYCQYNNWGLVAGQTVGCAVAVNGSGRTGFHDMVSTWWMWAECGAIGNEQTTWGYGGGGGMGYGGNVMNAQGGTGGDGYAGGSFGGGFGGGCAGPGGNGSGQSPGGGSANYGGNAPSGNGYAYGGGGAGAANNSGAPGGLAAQGGIIIAWADPSAEDALVTPTFPAGREGPIENVQDVG